MFDAWKEFSRGKRSKKDVSEFELRLEDNLFRLNEDLLTDRWKPDHYTAFQVQDPKLRIIHKASVRDRVLYQAIYRVLYQIFDKSFIYDVFSSRNLKGTHAGVDRLEVFLKKISANFTKPTFALKCDIRKFFDSVDHEMLFCLISKRISDRKTWGLIWQIIDSFHHTKGKGLPLGNVTSQLFANVYMDQLDKFIKNKLKVKYYIRYCDDFIILSNSNEILKSYITNISNFLKDNLRLELHPKKIEMRKIYQGIDFLGYVSLPHSRILRTRTKKRIMKKIEKLKCSVKTGSLSKEKFDQTIASYLGVLSHCNSYKLEKIMLQSFS